MGVTTEEEAAALLRSALWRERGTVEAQVARFAEAGEKPTTPCWVLCYEEDQAERAKEKQRAKDTWEDAYGCPPHVSDSRRLRPRREGDPTWVLCLLVPRGLAKTAATLRREKRRLAGSSGGFASWKAKTT